MMEGVLSTVFILLGILLYVTASDKFFFFFFPTARQQPTVWKLHLCGRPTLAQRQHMNYTRLNFMFLAGCKVFLSKQVLQSGPAHLRLLSRRKSVLP